MQTRESNSQSKLVPRKEFGKNALLGLIESLRSLVEGLRWKPEGTEWGNYYSDTNYSSGSMQQKHDWVRLFLDRIPMPRRTVWDLGANTGEFSAVATGLGYNTVAWDIDPAAVEKNYLSRRGDRLMLPLVQDLTNPSPSLGWALQERESLISRGPVQVVMALALIHHLAIGNNVPLPKVAEFFSSLGEWLVIEFVPKEDSQVQRLLATREDVFPDYTQVRFETAFQEHYEVIQMECIADTVRTLYLLRRRLDLS
jgi:ribosomal protein L11 methylase PrmA